MSARKLWGAALVGVLFLTPAGTKAQDKPAPQGNAAKTYDTGDMKGTYQCADGLLAAANLTFQPTADTPKVVIIAKRDARGIIQATLDLSEYKKQGDDLTNTSKVHYPIAGHALNAANGLCLASDSGNKDKKQQPDPMSRTTALVRRNPLINFDYIPAQ